MVTGVETVGLVLGSLPLIILAIEHYRRGLEPFKIWAKYRCELESLQKVLDMERAKLLNTCELLLEPLVPQSQLAGLISQPGGPRWKNLELQNNLKSLLRTAYSCFIGALEDMNEALNELLEKLDVDLGGKPRTTDKSSWERAIDRIKYSISAEKRTKLRKLLRSSNETLRTLTRSTLELAPSRSRRTFQAVDFERIRKTACSLHDALESGPWHCTCPSPHNANLRLEARVAGNKPPSTGQSDIVLSIRFRVLFSFTPEAKAKQLPPWNWHETDIVPLDDETGVPDLAAVSAIGTGHSATPSGPPAAALIPTTNNTVVPPARKKLRKRVRWTTLPTSPQCSIPVQPSSPLLSLKQIQDLCATLKTVCEGMGCLGYLTDTRKIRHGIYPVRKHPREVASQDIVRLSDLLSDPAPTATAAAPAIRGHLRKKERLYLAFTLASTVLQLHTTPWLRDSWNKSGILFLRQLGGTRDPIVGQPYISKPFASPRSLPLSCKNSEALWSSGPWIRNKSLFSLGVLLIELCFNKSLERMREPDDLGDDGKPNVYTDFATANRLIGEVYNEAGSRYGDAVRRCVRCDFDQREETFESDEFKQAVYQRVVVPLEEDLKDFCGGRLPLIQ